MYTGQGRLYGGGSLPLVLLLLLLLLLVLLLLLLGFESFQTSKGAEHKKSSTKISVVMMINEFMGIKLCQHVHEMCAVQSRTKLTSTKQDDVAIFPATLPR